MSIRTDLADTLTELFPDYKVVTTDRSLGTLDKLTLILSARTIAAGPTTGSADVTFDLSIVWPGLDLDKAEEALEDAVVGLLIELTTHFQNLEWSPARKGVYAARYPAWALDVKVRTILVNATPATPDPQE